MRRAEVEERQLEALRMRCADVGVRVTLEVDCEGEATIVIGAERFIAWLDAVVHVAALESSAGAQA